VYIAVVEKETSRTKVGVIRATRLTTQINVLLIEPFINLNKTVRSTDPEKI
jgi:hypothetical protein